MNALDQPLAVRALRLVGESLAGSGVRAPIRLVVAGGAAGLLAKLLAPSRTTADCDVIWVEDLSWASVAEAAAKVAVRLGLSSTWLNRECSHYAWCLPLDWRVRCKPVGTFGPLNVLRLSRIDLVATKVIGAPVRPQDLEDLRVIRPTSTELEFIDSHLDRLESEHLDGRSFDAERAIVQALRGVP